MQNKTASQFKMFQYTMNILGLPNVKNKKNRIFFKNCFNVTVFLVAIQKFLYLKLAPFLAIKTHIHHICLL